jgi:hypothetical protein
MKNKRDITAILRTACLCAYQVSGPGQLLCPGTEVISVPAQRSSLPRRRGHLHAGMKVISMPAWRSSLCRHEGHLYAGMKVIFMPAWRPSLCRYEGHLYAGLYGVYMPACTHRTSRHVQCVQAGMYTPYKPARTVCTNLCYFASLCESAVSSYTSRGMVLCMKIKNKLSTRRHGDLSPGPSPHGRGECSGGTKFLLCGLRVTSFFTRRARRKDGVPPCTSLCSPCLRVDNLFFIFMHKTMPRTV